MSYSKVPTRSDSNDAALTDISIGEIQDLRQSLTRKTSVIMAEDGRKTRRAFTMFGQQTSDGRRSTGLSIMEEQGGQLDDLLRPRNESVSLTLPSPYNIPSSSNMFVAKLQEAAQAIGRIIEKPSVKPILKCSITYFVASLAVYCTPIANLLGKSDSKHVVCTTCVYFHSARTKGSMLRSVLYASIALFYAFLVSISCMWAALFFYEENDFFLSSCVDLLGSSIALGTISFAKQRVNTPDFNVACSLSAISVISVVVKEGSLNANTIPFQKIHSIFMIVTAGVLISVAVCYFLWPTSAKTQLKINLDKSSKLLSKVLISITDKFLDGDNIMSPEFVQLDLALKKTLADLSKSLNEAKYEFFVSGEESQYFKIVNLVLYTKKLDRNLAGLRTSGEMHWALWNESALDNDHAEVRTLKSDYSARLQDDDMTQSKTTPSHEEEEYEGESDDDADDHIVAMNSTELFQLFVYHLGPSLKSFSLTMKQILQGVVFSAEFQNATTYQRSLRLASELFQRNHNRAVDKLYSQDIFREDALDKEERVQQEEVAAACVNFSTLLSQFGKELSEYLSILQDTEDVQTSYDWLKFWKWHPTQSEEQTFSLSTALSKFNGLKNNASSSGGLNFKIWKALRVFRRTDVQFGIRVGVGAFMISSLAFWDRTRQVFIDWKGEWILVTFCIVMNKSLGGTNMTVLWRFLGTFLGAVSAFLVWEMFEGDVIALALAGFLISIPSFHIILNWKDVNAFGRFILLTYNLTALYSYSMTQHDDEDGSEGGDVPIIQEIAFHRFVGVSAGAIFAVLLTLIFLPNSARSRLRKGLSVLWLRMGVIWNFDPLSYQYSPYSQENILVGIKDTSLTAIMTELELLLKQAPKEPRLKGLFPKEAYASILASTRKILDSFENMNTMIEVDKVLSSNEERVLLYTQQERTELCSRVFLVFYMISSAMALGFPIPSKPASIEHSQDRMLAKLNEIRSQEILENEDVVLLYSYVLVTNTISAELDKLIDLVGTLLGLVNEETFEL